MIFLTGSTGLLGSHILVELLKRDKKVKALKRPTSNLSNVKSVFAHFFKTDAENKFNQIEWVDGDVLDIVSLTNAMQNCTSVYHCAGLVSFVKRDFKKLMKVNKEGTANIVNTCLAVGIKELSYVSSTAAIGRSTEKLFYDETNKWVTARDNSNYAVSKYSAENEVWRGVEEGLNVVIVNPSVILGVGDWNDSSLSLFKAIKKGLKFYTPGANAFVDARDVAFCLSELTDRKIYNERFLVISENLGYKNLFELMANAFHVKAPSILTKPWMAQVAWRVEGVLNFLFKKKQNITKETAHSSMHTTKYSNDKIKAAIAHEFIPIEQSVNDAVVYFKKVY
ncbi:NAD-dependent epimerase/dehydratase family protein [Crocinitomix catalasitica]|uniref:NAD-dependent epimerase/dehydratase family protein n=1 Tax=Crocinitomix catalasitica TaxID=184607 RepID=UPI0004819C7B|nr:NAD-dependent epimerase/dehydratase family protein [Crocinitomix catalasitica]